MTVEKMIGLGSLAVVLLCWGLTCLTVVGAGEVGVVTHAGAVQPYVLTEGASLTRPWPFASVVKVSAQTVTTSTKAAAASKDMQVVHTSVALQWSASPGMAQCLYQRFGAGPDVWTPGLIDPAVQETVKAVAAQYTAVELITERPKVKAGVQEGMAVFIRNTLHERKCDGGIEIANVAMTDFDFSKEFNDSIEAKVRAEQDAQRAENEKKKKITQAEASAKEKTLAADANAYKTEVESKARAAAIERESKALEANPNLIQLRIAERWDGKLPTYTGTTVPLLQLK